MNSVTTLFKNRNLINEYLNASDMSQWKVVNGEVIKITTVELYHRNTVTLAERIKDRDERAERFNKLRKSDLSSISRTRYGKTETELESIMHTPDGFLTEEEILIKRKCLKAYRGRKWYYKNQIKKPTHKKKADAQPVVDLTEEPCDVSVVVEDDRKEDDIEIEIGYDYDPTAIFNIDSGLPGISIQSCKLDRIQHEHEENAPCEEEFLEIPSMGVFILTPVQNTTFRNFQQESVPPKNIFGTPGGSESH
jgi:hypothetical protein